MTETLDIARYSGIGQFGPAYRYMLENDSHAAGSVDRVSQEGMIRICAETADYLYGAHTSLDIKHQRGRARSSSSVFRRPALVPKALSKLSKESPRSQSACRKESPAVGRMICCLVVPKRRS